MQLKNQVIILGIIIFEKKKQTVESNSSADQDRKKRLPSYFAIAILLCHCCLDSKLYSLLLQYSGRAQYKNGVDLVEVSIFYKMEKTSGQTVRPKKIKTVALLYLIIGRDVV